MRPALVVAMVTLATAAQPLVAGAGLIALTPMLHEGRTVLAQAVVS